MIGFIIVCIIAALALYAPIFASSKPLLVIYAGKIYFPLARYFFSSTFFTSNIDLFCNAIALWLPLYFLASFVSRFLGLIVSLAIAIVFLCVAFFYAIDPAIDTTLNAVKEEKLQELLKTGYSSPDFNFDLRYMSPYAKLNMILDAVNKEKTHQGIVEALPKDFKDPYTLYSIERNNNEILKQQAKKEGNSIEFAYLKAKEQYIEHEKKRITYILYPFLTMYHWEDDAGGDQAMNRALPFWGLSRINRHDLLSALIFGARISLFVGIVATALSLVIGVPIGLLSGYVGGRLDILLCRFIEVWEAMPAFFMLLLIVTLVESKSIFLVITVIAVFNWTTCFRYVRAETFRQREMAYVEAARALGFPRTNVLFSQLLPNCIVPVIALLPFDIMAAITREAGLAFLGLGEEHSCSWGVLMDEGRAAFPQESALLWPPAIAITLLLMSIAFVGNALQNALDPKA